MRAWLPNCTRSQSLQLGCKKNMDSQINHSKIPKKKISRICRHYMFLQSSLGRPGPQRFTTWTCQRCITTCFRPSLSLEKSLEPLHCSVQSHAVMLRPWHGHHDPTDTAHRGTPSHQLRWRPPQILNLSHARKWTGCISFDFLEIMAHISCFIDLHCWLIVYGIVNCTEDLHYFHFDEHLSTCPACTKNLPQAMVAVSQGTRT